MLTQLAAFLSRLISLYSFFIWLRIIMSWFNPYPRQGSISWYFSRMVDPYLNLFRSRRFIIGYFDFSPLFAIALLSVAQSLLEVFAMTGYMSLSLVIIYLLQAFWSYGLSVLLIILIILLAIRTIASFTHSPGLSRMNGVTENIIRKVQMLFFPHRIAKESTIAIIALVIAVLAYFACRYLIILLMNLAFRIPL